MNSLRQMSLFAHIVEAGSLSAAADQLSLSKSVLSQHLKALEADLGVVLLKRTTRRQSLTDAGEAFYHKCQQLNALADDAWSEAQNSQQVPRGRIKLTAPHALMGTLVAPVIAELLREFPEIEPELIAADGQLDLMADGIDLAIRVGHSPSSNAKQRRIGAFRDVLCGNLPLLPAVEIEQQRYIANHWQGARIRHVLSHRQSAGQQSLEFTPAGRADSFHACQALLVGGAGIGILPEFIFRRTPVLEPLLPDHELPAVPVYGVYPFTGKPPRVVSLCLERIEKALSEAL